MEKCWDLRALKWKHNMCGIIAYKTKNKTLEHLDILLKLIYESKIRGLHSFGYSYFENSIMTTIKSFSIPTELKTFYKSQSTEFIYHNRYSTSGDWHSEMNGQPITHRDISIAMNGVISMKPRNEYEKEYGIKCFTDNDSEIFLKLLEKNISPEDIIHQIGGSCAVVWLDGNKTYAIRNPHRPLHYFKKGDAIFVCSTADIAYRAVGATTKEIPPYKLFDLDSHV